jgi:uncharacterized RDD family membrane protein YckC
MESGQQVFCSSCGKVVGPPFQFCGSCGSPVAARGMQATAPQWAGGAMHIGAGGYGVAVPVAAGFWIRVGAYLIDSVIYQMLIWLAGILFGGILGAGGAGAEAIIFQYVGLNLIIGWAYFAVQESSAAQATLGKRACGLVVVSETGGRLTLPRATGRYFAKGLSGLLLGVGLIIVAFTDRKRGMHDMMAGTYVIRKP